MALDLDVVGRETEAIERTWTVTDTLLYAVAVGAGQADPCKELAFTTENSAGVRLQALPTMAAVLSQGRWPLLGDVDMRKFLHVRESLELHGPWPATGRLSTTARVEAIHDKGSAAVVVVESRSVDVESGKPLATSRRSVFLGGEGGFGGDRGPAEEWVRPEREPDARVECRTRPEQALIYRLTGDRVRLHSDPTFAQSAGFSRPILHGMCTFGYAARVLVNEFCWGDADRLASIDVRFSSPVEPGAALDVLAWRDGDVISFQVMSGSRVVLDRGAARLR